MASEAGMSERETLSAQAYHERTKHSVASVWAGRRSLDWANQPRPYKLYADAAMPTIPLPRDWPSSGMDAIGALAASAAPGSATEASALDLPILATLLQHAA